jgi:hypothetical protein
MREWDVSAYSIMAFIPWSLLNEPDRKSLDQMALNLG